MEWLPAGSGPMKDHRQEVRTNLPSLRWQNWGNKTNEPTFKAKMMMDRRTQEQPWPKKQRRSWEKLPTLSGSFRVYFYFSEVGKGSREWPGSCVQSPDKMLSSSKVKTWWRQGNGSRFWSVFLFLCVWVTQCVCVQRCVGAWVWADADACMWRTEVDTGCLALSHILR